LMCCERGMYMRYDPDAPVTWREAVWITVSIIALMALLNLLIVVFR